MNDQNTTEPSIDASSVRNKNHVTVYILGAGCSYACGYPLFSEYTEVLQSFGDKLEGSEERHAIRKSVQKTVALLKNQPCSQKLVSTIDELVRLIRRGECDDYLEKTDSYKACRRGDQKSNQIARRKIAIRNAKIATAALFLEKEREALENDLLARYYRFIADELQFDCNLHWAEKLKRSSVRVLSFNYDRMFEYAFAKHFNNAFSGHSGLYTSNVLNSGINLQGQHFARIEQGRFCFLKLHGSVGVDVKKDEYGESTHFDEKQILDWKPPAVVDDLYFQTGNGVRADPLIAFPHEKEEVLTGRDHLHSFDRYISHVWKHAELVLSEASEIFIVGYSIPDLDAKRVLGFLNQATGCRHIIIRNSRLEECERIKELLAKNLKNRIPITVEPRPF